MRKMRRKLAVLLVFVLAFTMMPQNVLAAKKKVKLSKKSVTITVGKTVKVKLKDRKSTRLNSSHREKSRMPSSA